MSFTLEMSRYDLDKRVYGVLKESSGTVGPFIRDVPIAEGNEKNGKGSKTPGALPGNSE